MKIRSFLSLFIFCHFWWIVVVADGYSEGSSAIDDNKIIVFLKCDPNLVDFIFVPYAVEGILQQFKNHSVLIFIFQSLFGIELLLYYIAWDL